MVHFNLNKPQARFLTVLANDSNLFWSRGTGKTQGAGAPWILHKVEAMPGSCGAIAGQSFADLEAKILKPLFMGFHMLGHELDVHYLYGKKPPAKWKKPLTPIVDYSRVISFPNGTTIQLISMHQKGSANSNSFQWIYVPEAKFMDARQFRQEVFPTLRGLVREFGLSPWYGAKLLETDKYSPDIHWLLQKRQLHNEQLVSTVIFYQLTINELKARLPAVSRSTAYKLKQEIAKYETLLAIIRKNLVYVGEANAYDNIANLSPDFIENMRRSLTEYEFNIAILNHDPTRAEHCFYPDRTEKNLYNHEFDEDVTKPLAIALDNQASISPLVWCQLNDLAVPGMRSLNFLGASYVKHPLGVRHVIDNFCTYYQDRPCKEVIYFYNHTFVAKSSISKPFFEYVIDCFKENRWKVAAIYTSQAPEQIDKYNRVNFYLRNADPEFPPVMIHKHHCADMLLSMDLAEAMETSSGTKKNKTNERKLEIPQETTTHFSDVFDELVWSILELNLYPSAQAVPTFVGLR
jgi:hypothetical protein